MIYLTPSKTHLERFAPIEIWAEAIKQAQRSDHKRHRTGCIIYYGKEIFAKGCSHTHNGGLRVHSVHAEMDALGKYKPPASYFHHCMIVTLTKANNFASVSKPCSTCAKLLMTKVSIVTYCERNNDGSWRIEWRSPTTLQDLSETKYG